MTFFPSFPLLARELAERAAQRRTYVVRVIYAMLLFAPFVAAYVNFAKGSNVSASGLGRQLFVVLTWFQFGGIYLLLPVLMCGAITREKERDSLSLLLLTRLTPGEIILQKYFGGLVPMFSFLLLSLPLAALAYGMGGLGLRDLAFGGFLLLLAALQTAAVALLASVWCRSTAGAILLAFPLSIFWPLLRIADQESVAFLPRTLFGGMFDSVLFPPLGWLQYLYGGATAGIITHGAGLGLAVPLLVLLLARALLTRRAFLPQRRRLRQFTSRFDRLARRLNRALGAKIFPQGKRSLPGHNPIAWLESTRSVLAHRNHVVRLALLLECLAGPIALNLALLDSRKGTPALDALFAILVGMAVLVAAMWGANAFVTERVNQTLEVMLTTPVSAAQMIRERASIVYRLLLAGIVPVGTVVGIATLQRIAQNENGADVSLIAGVTAIGAFLIDVPLAWWLALGLSIKSRARVTGMMWGVGGALALFVLPSLLLHAVTIIIGHESRALHDVVILFSPLEIFRMIAGYDRPDLSSAFRLGMPVVHLGIFGALLCVIQQRCLQRAEYYLRG